MAPGPYATPGIYVEEISTLPPSVAEIGTAIPAFIGLTAKHDQNIAFKAIEIRSLREFETCFGKSPPTEWMVKAERTEGGDDFIYTVHYPPTSATTNPSNETVVPRFSEPRFILWYSIDHYFRNGGGRCYVVSVGRTTEDTAADHFSKGINELEKHDEPTLIVIPEAIRLDDADYKAVCDTALMHAGKLQDRFTILDCKTTELTITASVLISIRANFGASNLDRGAAYFPFLNTTLTHLVSDSNITVSGLKEDNTELTTKLDTLKDSQTSHYNQIKRLLADQRVILPPSAAIAGVYSRVDRERGVWKAPANVSLQAVVSPVIQITDDDQAQLNIDATTGKSINAIRSFAGVGTLVWGARTLDGNSNEWRYIPVRRLFISVEESIKKATSFAVFEPNDVSTWLKVNGMIDSYLYSLWQRGALQGSKAEQAYFVKVGLGNTMDQDDILNGRLIVEIGLAAVRPAEFIILRFSHKLVQ